MKKSLIAATIAAAMVSGSAAAAVIDFNFAGNGGLKDKYVFNQGGLSVTASAGVYSGGKYDETANYFPLIGQYEGGLGVTSKLLDDHAVDNKSGIDYVKFAFDQPVQVSGVSVTFACFIVCADSDVSYLLGDTTGNAWTNITSGTNYGLGVGQHTFTLTGLAAIDTFRFGARFGQSDDSFKILGMSVSVEDPAQVPMPAPLMLLGAGLLALGASRRATSSSAGVSR